MQYVLEYGKVHDFGIWALKRPREGERVLELTWLSEGNMQKLSPKTTRLFNASAVKVVLWPEQLCLGEREQYKSIPLLHACNYVIDQVWY